MNHALIVIDVQNDFCSGGTLAVPNGAVVVEPCNALMAAASTSGALVVLSQDWHPAGHHSFASTHSQAPFSTTQLPYGEQVLWPDHCVQGTSGAGFHPDLHTDRSHLVVRKGFRREVDSYSAFQENDRLHRTGLAGWLREHGVERVELCGLALDYCVQYTAMDALTAGFQVAIHDAATRGIDPIGVTEAWASLLKAGVERL